MSEDTVRILIIDDDPDDIVLLTDDLAGCGYEVWTASNGEHALAQAQAQPVDIALLDVRLPGLTGLELIREIAARGGDVSSFVPITVRDAIMARLGRLAADAAQQPG